MVKLSVQWCAALCTVSAACRCHKLNHIYRPSLVCTHAKAQFMVQWLMNRVYGDHWNYFEAEQFVLRDGQKVSGPVPFLSVKLAIRPSLPHATWWLLLETHWLCQVHSAKDILLEFSVHWYSAHM